MNLLKYSFIFFFIFYGFSCFSQSNNPFFNDLNIQGAPFNQRVNVLFEDSIGFLWIGTNTGLYRYDGNKLIQYQNDVFNSFSIPNNSINSIIEDNNQNLWIGSESFLVCYNRKQDKFKGFYKNITSTVLYKTSEGKIIANPKNTGLVIIEPHLDFNKIKLDSHFNYQDNQGVLIFNKQINTFIEDNFKRFWVGTNKGLYFLDNKGKYIQTNFTNEVIAMKNAGDNAIIVLTKNDLYKLGYNKTNNNLEILESYLGIMDSFEKDSSLSCVSLSPTNNNLWIGTTNGLVKAVRNNNKYQFNYYSKESTNTNLINDQINSTIYDSYGNLWIGSAKGINKLLGRTSLFDFYNLCTLNKLKNLNTQSIFLISESNMLIGTNKGIYRYNPKTNKCDEIKTNFANEFNYIGKIVKNYNNSELLISSNNNLFETFNYKPNTTNFTLKKIKTFSKRITDLAIISNNETWVGLWDGGIDIVNNASALSEFKKSIIQKLSNNHTSAFLVTSDNKLWIGTRGEGLFKVDFNKESLEEFLPNKDGLSSNAILSLHEDSNKRIWVGTRGGGLNYYNEKCNCFKNFNNRSGLAPNTVAAIEEDNSGNLWMSTHEGITRLDIRTEKFIPFGIEDGIKEIYFTFNSSSANKNKKKLYFGNTDGFYTVSVDKFLPKEKVPSTVITSFTKLVDSKSSTTRLEFNTPSNIDFNSDEPTVLNYDQNNIVINFSSLDLTTPNKNQYAYMLEGLNDYWLYTTASNRNANYNDLPPGKYTFKVKSANSDGVWNEKPTLLHFTITPPFWKSTLAYLLYGILASIILYISFLLIKRWYKLKKNLVKETISREKDNEHSRMKMVFFTDISHELRTPLSLILGTIEKVVKEKEFLLSPHTAQRIYNNTLRMHRLINQIMDIRKFDVGRFNLSISKNDIVKDVNIIKDSFNDFAKIYGITYEFITKEEKVKGWYDVDILEKTLFNLLSNAFKYTKENGCISVTLELANINNNNLSPNLELEKNKYIKCTVRDNGMGIPKKDLPFIFDRYYQATKTHSNQIPGTGIGMELVQKLIERHHGKIMVESEENVFTEFTFYLPIYKSRYSKNERIKTGMPLKRNFIQNSEYQVIEEVSSEFDAEINSKEISKPKIIIVEDNEDLRRMVKDELKEDFYVIEASNGKEGYDTILKEKPLLIVSDILMPIEDGISMLKRIKKNKEINNIPIFMLTAKNSDETKIECLSLGADDYIEKPFSLEFVKWKVKNTLITRSELKEKYSKVITAEPSDIEIDSNDEKFIKKLIKIIEDTMDDNLLSVEYLASEVGMSRANLYRKLQTIINDTPVNFIKKIKLKRAAQLLKKNDLYISEIAYMTGFNNQKYFGKCFQKEYNMSPSEYIKTYADIKNREPINFS
ncbi:two-component regulator propeller domain-containing protein [Mariniflexile sp.]|uniref:two-component regulator propeller domain-containing protein n=1 Tax=Mariniflexile sp. TaxID=1979402 RepID=UPI0035646CCF